MGNEIEQNAIEQVDVIGTKIRGPRNEQVRDPPGRLGPPPGIAAFDDFIKLRNQRRSDYHQSYSNRRLRRAFRSSSCLPREAQELRIGRRQGGFLQSRSAS